MIRNLKRFAASVLLAPFGWASAMAVEPGGYDELPGGRASEVARLYYSALELPGVGDWGVVERAALLDVATLRYRDRLVNRAPSGQVASALRHIGRLVASEAASGGAVAQACARYGLIEGPCAGHVGYVRRAMVLEEMLVQGQVDLDGLEIELVGAVRARPGEERIAR